MTQKQHARLQNNDPRREAIMTGQEFDRRGFLKGAVVGGAAAATAATIATPDIAQAEAPASAVPDAAGYAFFNLDEAAFIEALVDHMIPADEISPKGTDLGVNVYIDRARSRAVGARAIGSICRGPGNRALRARATSCR
jgi:gluconate 2-dehydrogenase subunit 3-like protein/TAT (twin-arginine translocation) pathway-exported protein